MPQNSSINRCGLYEGLMQKALALLSKRKYTVLGMKKKLVLFYEKKIEKGEFPPTTKPEMNAEIRKVLDRLKELNYLNDTQYSKDYISDRVEFHPRGKFLIKRELRTKGIHPELIEKIVDEEYEDESDAAFQALEKRMKRLASLPKGEQKEKAMRFLASRGFKIDTIYKVINNWYDGVEIR